MATKCPKCQFDNTADSKFCKECGTQLTPSEGPQVSKTLTMETQAEELTRGTVFAGRYEILEELGTGGMGSIYRVFDRKLEEEVALKLIRPDITADRKTIERFKNELKVVRKITHPNVCRMHDLHEEEKTLYITMEYVRGEDLKSVIHRMGMLTMGKAISIAQQVAEGLAEAHKLGIVHRDLKPGNIMIDKEGNAKIMDFGIARTLAGIGTTAEGVMIGTPEYMSPEQVEGRPADARSDLYALGVILFEMVTGRPPFEGDSAMGVALKHKADRLFEELKRRSEKEFVTPTGLFFMNLERGHLAEAFRWLKKAGETNDPNLSWMRIAPREMLKSSAEPKFITLIKKGFVKAMMTRTISRYRITDDTA